LIKKQCLSYTGGTAVFGQKIECANNAILNPIANKIEIQVSKFMNRHPKNQSTGPKRVKAYLALVTAVVLAGCSNAPSSGDIEKALEASIGPCENVEIVDVKKTNGYQEEGLYQVQYKAALVVKDKSELNNLHHTWLNEYEQVTARLQANKEFEARISQLGKEADALRASVGPEPGSGDFDSLRTEYERFNAYHAAKDAWRERADEAAKPKTQEIQQLRQQELQEPRPNFVVVGKESEVTTGFFYKGCPQQAMEYVSAAIPEMAHDQNGLLDPAPRLSFTRADLKGEMTMRKTENGWQKI
jgi:hypothetical protein